ncbi:hypothetical protein [Hyphomicrobium sp.]|uniref:hypothetical protein n=1 Tax=Hyphomicrobium sp. TaxID=82 RepID=UPI0025BC42AF|nr:hypothetical protein [Hyphomicrobium sp.]MCC7251683.1 hypothetical protein [Hyphomicrobium sp.]
MKAVKKTLPVLAALLLCASHARAGEEASTALTEDECRAIWNTAAGRSDLGPDGAKSYIDSFESVDTNRDKKISNAEFKAGCAAGLVHKFRSQQSE